MVCDINGLELTKGDVVAPVSGDMKGKVCGLKTEDGEGFVCVRAAHRPYSKGVWYAAEHVQRLAIGKVRTRKPADGEAESDAGATTRNSKAAARADGKSNGKASTAPARKGASKTGARKGSSTKRSGRRAVTTTN